MQSSPTSRTCGQVMRANLVNSDRLYPIAILTAATLFGIGFGIALPCTHNVIAVAIDCGIATSFVGTAVFGVVLGVLQHQENLARSAERLRSRCTRRPTTRTRLVRTGRSYSTDAQFDPSVGRIATEPPAPLKPGMPKYLDEEL